MFPIVFSYSPQALRGYARSRGYAFVSRDVNRTNSQHCLCSILVQRDRRAADGELPLARDDTVGETMTKTKVLLS